MDTQNRYGESRRGERSREELHSRFYENNRNPDDNYNYYDRYAEGYAIPYESQADGPTASDIYEQEIGPGGQRTERYEGRYGWYEHQNNDPYRNSPGMNDLYRREASEPYRANTNPDYNYGSSGRGSYNNDNDMRFSERRGPGMYEADRNMFQRAGDRIREAWNEWSGGANDRNDERQQNYPGRDQRNYNDWQEPGNSYPGRNSYRQNRYEEGEAY